MHTGLHPCSGHPAANLQLLCDSTAVLVFKTQSHGLRDGTKQGQSLHAGLLLSLAKTAIIGPRNCHERYLAHCAAPSHSFPPQFPDSLPSVCPHCSLHHQNGAAWKLPLSEEEGAGTTDTSSATEPDTSCSYTQSSASLILTLTFRRRWVRQWRVNVEKQSSIAPRSSPEVTG